MFLHQSICWLWTLFIQTVLTFLLVVCEKWFDLWLKHHVSDVLDEDRFAQLFEIFPGRRQILINFTGNKLIVILKLVYLYWSVLIGWDSTTAFVSIKVWLFPSLLSCRRGAEPQPGPSGRQCSRQGYCGYCRVLYSNLDQVRTLHAPLYAHLKRSCGHVTWVHHVSSLSTCPVSNTWIPSALRPEAPALCPPAMEPYWNASCMMSCSTTRTATRTPGNKNKRCCSAKRCLWGMLSQNT